MVYVSILVVAVEVSGLLLLFFAFGRASVVPAFAPTKNTLTLKVDQGEHHAPKHCTSVHAAALVPSAAALSGGGSPKRDRGGVFLGREQPFLCLQRKGGRGVECGDGNRGKKAQVSTQPSFCLDSVRVC